MSERVVSIKTYWSQRPYGDSFYRAEVDFHMTASGFGGCPPEEAAIRVVKALWPSAERVDFECEPFGEHTHYGSDGRPRSDQWCLRGRIDYAG